MAQAPALPRGFELPLEPRLPRVGSVDQVAVEERADALARRSIKREAKLFALDLAVRMTDLTTLEGADTPGKIAALASKAVRPDPADATVPSVAAVCVYPNLVPFAKEKVEGTGVKVASVATAFPAGQSPTDIKVEDARRAAEAGVWTEKGSRILSMAQRLRAGVVWANTYNRFDPSAPFGGYKESGFGREGGLHGLEPYLDFEGKVDTFGG
jgi:hypothetical protein